MVLRFGLFPSCLNALAVFFCRSEDQLPYHVLRSDPSIECYNGEHWLAFVVALLVVGIWGVAVPITLFIKIKRGRLDQVLAAILSRQTPCIERALEIWATG